jgi:hypothetical protein
MLEFFLTSNALLVAKRPLKEKDIQMGCAKSYFSRDAEIG